MSMVTNHKNIIKMLLHLCFLCDIIGMHLFESQKLRGSPQQKRPDLRDGSFYYSHYTLGITHDAAAS